MRFLGVDLAWGRGTAARPANRTGVVSLEADGSIVAAGWTIGLDATARWIADEAVGHDVLAFIDAPLLILNDSGQRECEREVGQRYGTFKVSANSTNLASRHAAGVALREALEQTGWRYDDGLAGAPTSGRTVSECYPYTTLVGANELGYEVERPRYKRTAKGMPAAQAWPVRTAACDELIRRVAGLAEQDPRMDLCSHQATRELVELPSPAKAAPYKQREDLLDAALCAWSAALWHRYGCERCQVLGATSQPDLRGRRATIIAPARDSQRR